MSEDNIKLRARRTEGGTYTPDDRLEIKLDYVGPIHHCVHYLEVVSGGEVTHGGGASSDSPLHYKAQERDADGDGIIDYSTVQMTLVQTQRGRNDVKVCCEVVTQEEYEQWQKERDAWVEKNAVQTEHREHNYKIFAETGYAEEGAVGKMSFIHEDGNSYLVNEGTKLSDMPPSPRATVYKTGEITLEWHEDKFV
jgi:hypothetical protein